MSTSEARQHLWGRLERFGGAFASERLRSLINTATEAEVLELVRVLDATYATGKMEAPHVPGPAPGVFRTF